MNAELMRMIGLLDRQSTYPEPQTRLCDDDARRKTIMQKVDARIIPPDELDAIQRQCRAELRQLRLELQAILEELRLMAAMRNS